MDPIPQLTVGDFYALMTSTGVFLATCWIWSVARRWF
jgi:hypothetical protein